MSDFWLTLSGLIEKYTVADIAFVISIISGFATVVAAVGAIIAVVITKKIAIEQIEIAKKQNDISAAQADIAKQQNKISLFKERYETYQHICYFLNSWSMALLLYSPKPNSDVELAEAYKESDKFMSRYYIYAQPDFTVPDFSKYDTNVSTVFYMRNTYHLRRIHRLFQLSSSDLEYIKKIEAGFVTIAMAVSLNNVELTPQLDKFEECINEFFRLVPNNKVFLNSLEQQVDVYKCE